MQSLPGVLEKIDPRGLRSRKRRRKCLRRGEKLFPFFSLFFLFPCLFQRGLARRGLERPGSTGCRSGATLLPALLPVVYSQGLGGDSYSFLLSFRARAFFIPLTFLSALLIPRRGRVSPFARAERSNKPTNQPTNGLLLSSYHSHV